MGAEVADHVLELGGSGRPFEAKAQYTSPVFRLLYKREDANWNQSSDTLSGGCWHFRRRQQDSIYH